MKCVLCYTRNILESAQNWDVFHISSEYMHTCTHEHAHAYMHVQINKYIFLDNHTHNTQRTYAYAYCTYANCEWMIKP